MYFVSFSVVTIFFFRDVMKSHLLPFLFVSFYRLLTRGGKVLIEDTACPRNESPSLATQGAREREREGESGKGKSNAPFGRNVACHSLRLCVCHPLSLSHFCFC